MLAAETLCCYPSLYTPSPLAWYKGVLYGQTLMECMDINRKAVFLYTQLKIIGNKRDKST